MLRFSHRKLLEIGSFRLHDCLIALAHMCAPFLFAYGAHSSSLYHTIDVLFSLHRVCLSYAFHHPAGLAFAVPGLVFPAFYIPHLVTHVSYSLFWLLVPCSPHVCIHLPLPLPLARFVSAFFAYRTIGYIA